MKKTVKWMGSIAVVCMSVLGLTGCSSLSSIPNNVAPGVANKTGVVQVSSSCLNAEYPKTFYVVADKAVKNSPYLEEVKAYTVNGLKYIGMTEAVGESAAKLIVTINFSSTQANRMVVRYSMSAAEKGKICWTVNANCSTRPGDIQNYLPGLVAAAMPSVGVDRAVSVTNLRKYPQYVKAVMGSLE